MTPVFIGQWKEDWKQLEEEGVIGLLYGMFSM